MIRELHEKFVTIKINGTGKSRMFTKNKKI